MSKASDFVAAVFELIQGGARSGATRIDVFLDEGGRTITVEDDGDGIADAGVLLALAEKAWTPEIMGTAVPYGPGFVAALFVAEDVQVESRTFSFSGKTDDIRALKPVELIACTEQTSTRITLRRVYVNFGALESTIRTRLVGFPVRVSVNGAEIPRPLALEGEGWRSTAVGRVRLNLDAFVCQQVLMLQGEKLVGHVPSDSGVAVHLDPSRFVRVGPQGSELAGRAAAEVQEEVRALARQLLQEAKATLPPDVFVVRHAEHCLCWSCLDLLNDVDFLPAEWLRQWNDLPRHPGDLGDLDDLFEVIRPQGEVIHRDELPAAVLHRLDEDDLVCSNWPLLVYAWRMGFPVLSVELHEGHWVYDRLATLPTRAGWSDDRTLIEVRPGKLVGERVLHGTWEIILRVYEDISLIGPAGEVSLPSDAGVHYCDNGRLVLAIHAETKANVLLQSYGYTQDGLFLDHFFEEESNRFYRLKRHILGGKTPECLTVALTEAGIYEEVLGLLSSGGPIVLSESGGFIVATSPRD